MEIHGILLTLQAHQMRLVVYHYTMEWLDKRKRYLRYAMSKSRYYAILGEARREIERKLLTP